MKAKARICIADDHELFRAGLVQLINHQSDMEVVGEAGDGLEILTLTRAQKPDLILMDIHMPISDGIEATYLIRESGLDVVIIMLTVLDSDEQLIEAIRAGANGYLLKTVSSEGFLQAVRGVLKGEATLPPRLVPRLIREYAALANRSLQPTAPDNSPTLTSREVQVLELIASAASNQQIADQLGTSLFTIKSHVRNILSKLGAKNRWEAIHIAQGLGLLRVRKRGTDRAT